MNDAEKMVAYSKDNPDKVIPGAEGMLDEAKGALPERINEAKIEVPKHILVRAKMDSTKEELTKSVEDMADAINLIDRLSGAASAFIPDHTYT